MSTSLEKAVGPRPTVNYYGRTITLATGPHKILAALESHLRTALPDPIEALKPRLEGLHVEVQKVLMMEAYRLQQARGTVADPEFHAFLRSHDGWAFVIWQAAKKEAPDLTVEQWAAWAKEQEDDHVGRVIKSIMGQLSSEDPSKNSRSQPTRKRARKGKLTGNTSTGSSPSVTRGQARRRFLTSPTTN